MALVSVNRPNQTVDLTTPLSSALLAFEKVLSDEQKLIFRGNYTKPETGDVVAFVSRIDAESKGRARRCVAPRLCTFLNSAVQFTGIIDTFVSSNPPIAALVWGSVKTALLTASHAANYFDKITGLIMQIGRTSPTLQQFGQLYPGSLGLQAALCRYYTIVIHLCTKIIQISRRSNWAQLVAPAFTPFEIEFRPFLDDLAEATKEVDVQCSLAFQQAAREDAQLAEYDRRQSAAHRRLVQRFQANAQREQREARTWRCNAIAREKATQKHIILNALSHVDHIAVWKQAKAELLPGTAEWFERHDGYKAWLAHKGSSILWCSGKLGSGKTVLAANMVSRLLETQPAPDRILYFFCRFDVPDTLVAKHILGSICRQLLEVHLDQMTEAELGDLLLKVKTADAKQLVALSLLYLRDDATHYVIMDGLDEADHDLHLIAEALNILRGSAHTKTFKIICTGRTGSDKALTDFTQPDYKIIFRTENVEEDIDKYVHSALDQRLEDGTLSIGDPRLIFKIVETLREDAQGMFLWVRLVLEELCEQVNDEDILATLLTIPRQLSKLFDRKMNRLRERPQGALTTKILQSCGIACRPLHLNELRELLSIELGQTSRERAKLPNDMYRLVGACCGLVFIDEETSAVHYVHSSVRHYLFNERPTGNSDFDEEKQFHRLGLLCLTYLNFGDFDRRIRKRFREADTQIKPVDLCVASLEPLGSRSVLFRRLLQRMPTQKSFLSTQQLLNRLQDVTTPTTSTTVMDYWFLEYAKIHWIYHLKREPEDEGQVLLRMFKECVTGINALAFRPWTDDADIHHETAPEQWWSWMVKHDLVSLMRTFNFVVHESQFSWTMLVQACAYNRKALVKLVLSRLRPDCQAFAQALSDVETDLSSAALPCFMNSLPIPSHPWLILGDSSGKAHSHSYYILGGLKYAFLRRNLVVLSAILSAVSTSQLLLDYYIGGMLLVFAARAQQNCLLRAMIGYYSSEAVHQQESLLVQNYEIAADVYMRFTEPFVLTTHDKDWSPIETCEIWEEMLESAYKQDHAVRTWAAMLRATCGKHDRTEIWATVLRAAGGHGRPFNVIDKQRCDNDDDDDEVSRYLFDLPPDTIYPSEDDTWSSLLLPTTVHGTSRESRALSLFLNLHKLEVIVCGHEPSLLTTAVLLCDDTVISELLDVLDWNKLKQTIKDQLMFSFYTAISMREWGKARRILQPHFVRSLCSDKETWCDNLYRMLQFTARTGDRSLWDKLLVHLRAHVDEDDIPYLHIVSHGVWTSRSPKGHSEDNHVKAQAAFIDDMTSLIGKPLKVLTSHREQFPSWPIYIGGAWRYRRPMCAMLAGPKGTRKCSCFLSASGGAD